MLDKFFNNVWCMGGLFSMLALTELTRNENKVTALFFAVAGVIYIGTLIADKILEKA